MRNKNPSEEWLRLIDQYHLAEVVIGASLRSGLAPNPTVPTNFAKLQQEGPPSFWTGSRGQITAMPILALGREGARSGGNER